MPVGKYILTGRKGCGMKGIIAVFPYSKMYFSSHFHIIIRAPLKTSVYI